MYVGDASSKLAIIWMKSRSILLSNIEEKLCLKLNEGIWNCSDVRAAVLND